MRIKTYYRGCRQWRNSWRRGRGADTFRWGFFVDQLGKERKMEKKKNCKMEGGKLKLRREGMKMSREGLFETKICLGSTKMEISTRKKALHAGKKIGKSDFAPLEKYSS